MVKVTGTCSGVVMYSVNSLYLGAAYGRNVTKKSLPPWSSPACGSIEGTRVHTCTTVNIN